MENNSHLRRPTAAAAGANEPKSRAAGPGRIAPSAVAGQALTLFASPAPLHGPIESMPSPDPGLDPLNPRRIRNHLTTVLGRPLPDWFEGMPCFGDPPAEADCRRYLASVASISAMLADHKLNRVAIAIDRCLARQRDKLGRWWSARAGDTGDEAVLREQLLDERSKADELLDEIQGVPNKFYRDFSRACSSSRLAVERLGQLLHSPHAVEAHDRDNVGGRIELAREEWVHYFEHFGERERERGILSRMRDAVSSVSRLDDDGLRRFADRELEDFGS